MSDVSKEVLHGRKPRGTVAKAAVGLGFGLAVLGGFLYWVASGGPLFLGALLLLGMFVGMLLTFLAVRDMCGGPRAWPVLAAGVCAGALALLLYG